MGIEHLSHPDLISNPLVALGVLVISVVMKAFSCDDFAKPDDRS